MKRLFSKLIFNFYQKDLNAPAYSTPPIVVLGVPRSGTSLVSRLVRACDVSFGDKSLMRPADSRNPDGFLELVEMNKIDDRLVHESGFQNHLAAEEWFGLRAVAGRKFSRFLTLCRMGKLVQKLVDMSGGKKWAFKQTPITFYWWKRFVPNARIVAVYREPHTTAESIHRTFKRFTFEQALRWWTKGNTELLFHISQTESILIKFEDLSNPFTQRASLEKIATFCGGDISVLEAVLKSEEGTQRQKAQTVIGDIPLTRDTNNVYQALEKASGRIPG